MSNRATCMHHTDYESVMHHKFQYAVTIGDMGSITTSDHEFKKITEPFRIVKVPEDADEDERKNLKFATKIIPYYNPLAGYAYYEFTQRAFILPERNVIAEKNVCINNDWPVVILWLIIL